MSSPSTRSFDSIVSLKASAGTVNQETIQLLGYYLPGDGGGGVFYWDSTSTATDDDGVIIQVTGVSIGRWLREIVGPVNGKWFGATGDGITDDTANCRKVFTYIDSQDGGEVFFPSGIYLLKLFASAAALDIGSNTTVKGAGIGATIFKRADNDANSSRLFTTSATAKVIFRDFTIDGNKEHQCSTYEQQHNFFHTNYSEDLYYENLNIINTVGDGIYFHTGTQKANITNCIFDGITRVGINMTCLNEGKVIGSRFLNIITNGIKIEKNQVDLTSPSRNIVITACYFEAGSNNTGAAGINMNGLSGDLVVDVVVNGNNFFNIDYGVLGLKYVDNIEVSNNTGDTIKSLCRSLSYSSGLGNISGNLIMTSNSVVNGIGGTGADDIIYALYYFKRVVIRGNMHIENPSFPYNIIGRVIENAYCEFTHNYTIASGLSGGVVFLKCPTISYTENYTQMNVNKDQIILSGDPSIPFVYVGLKNNRFDGVFRYVISGTSLIGTAVLNDSNNTLFGSYTGQYLGIPFAFLKTNIASGTIAPTKASLNTAYPGAIASDQIIYPYIPNGGVLAIKVDNSTTGDWLILQGLLNVSPMPIQTGKKTLSGDGTTTTFAIPHGLGAIPSSYQITPASHDAVNVYAGGADATNLYAVFAVAPSLGTNNIILSWLATL